MQRETKRVSQRCFAIVVVAVTLMTGVARAQNIGVFVSSQTTNGNMGGLTGADNICQSLGAVAFPGSGPWVAWLSDSTTNARDRIPTPGAGGAYVRASQPGIVIANDLTDLTDGSLSAPILLDEAGAAPPIIANTGRATAWTGTTTSGTVDAANRHCTDWGTAGAALGIGGASELSNTNWTFGVSADCVREMYLYCFDAITPPTPVPATSPLSNALLAILFVTGVAYLYRRRKVVAGQRG